MRVGTRVGPFYASTSTAGCGPWVVAFIAILVVVALVIDHPVIAAIVGVIIIYSIFWAVHRSRRRHRQAVQHALATAEAAPMTKSPQVAAAMAAHDELSELVRRFDAGELSEAKFLAQTERLIERES